jgi:hypothetical protein
LKHFVTIEKFLRWGVAAPRPTPKIEDHPLSAVRDCLFNIFAAILRTRRRWMINIIIIIIIIIIPFSRLS